MIIGAGGTGGHIIPAIVIAKELEQRGWDITFIGNKCGMEEDIVLHHGYRFLPIKVQKIYRKLTIAHLKFPFLLIRSLFLCLSYINKTRPEAVLCTGGFVSGPVALAALILGVPLYIQDGNSYPGLTTRTLSPFTKNIFIASDFAKQYLKTKKCINTGNPLVKYDRIDKASIVWSDFNLRQDSKKLFILGGSQGSIVINKAVGKCLEEILNLNVDIIWQTGKSHNTIIISKYGLHKGIHIFDFTDKMNMYYQMADLAISRAGALSIAELEEYKIPAIFIPLPTAAENHQLVNAKAQIEKGVGLLLEQKTMTPLYLMTCITKLLNEFDVFKAKLNNLPPNNASTAIADQIEREITSL